MNLTSASDTIVQEIVIHAPAERIFEALTSPAQRVEWWGAEGRFQATEMESDLRPGGKWTMRGGGLDGRPFKITGQYREVEPPRLLVFTWLPDWQKGAVESIVRFELTPKGGLTTVRLTHSGLITENSRLSHKGWPDILVWLRAYAEGRTKAERHGPLPE
jgi:uncharacterized protein YndB with AHSA1/START domain